jgi:hypothetical protein
MSKITRAKWTNCDSRGRHLLCKCEVMSSNARTTKKSTPFIHTSITPTKKNVQDWVWLGVGGLAGPVWPCILSPERPNELSFLPSISSCMLIKIAYF